MFACRHGVTAHAHTLEGLPLHPTTRIYQTWFTAFFNKINNRVFSWCIDTNVNSYILTAKKIAIRTNFQPLNLLIRFVLRHWVINSTKNLHFMGRVVFLTLLSLPPSLVNRFTTIPVICNISNYLHV